MRNVELAAGPAATSLSKIYDQMQNQHAGAEMLRNLQPVLKKQRAKRTKKQRAKSKQAKQARKRNR
jgi:predicted flavoprotein YhiN